MPIVGAVLTLVPDRLQARVDAWKGDARVLCGAPTENRLPVVVETDSRQEDKDFWRAVETDPAVLNVEIAFAHFADLTLSPASNEVQP